MIGHPRNRSTVRADDLELFDREIPVNMDGSSSTASTTHVGLPAGAFWMWMVHSHPLRNIRDRTDAVLDFLELATANAGELIVEGHQLLVNDGLDATNGASMASALVGARHAVDELTNHSELPSSMSFNTRSERR